jgi:ATP-dependent Lon protease
MYVETSRMTNGTGQLTLTGQLGDVMRESAQLAMVWLRANSAAYAVSVCAREQTRVVQLDGDMFISHDTHVHLPAGAISKDGPSAGITVLVALLSLYSGRRVRADTAVTGEITLRGVLLPVRCERGIPTLFDAGGRHQGQSDRRTSSGHPSCVHAKA